jgi:hypothetical protein
LVSTETKFFSSNLGDDYLPFFNIGFQKYSIVKNFYGLSDITTYVLHCLYNAIRDHYQESAIKIILMQSPLLRCILTCQKSDKKFCANYPTGGKCGERITWNLFASGSPFIPRTVGLPRPM